MNKIRQMLQALGLEETPENIARVARLIGDTSVEVSRAIAGFAGQAGGELADNPVRGYGNYLRGLGSGALGLSRFLPGDSRAEQALMRLAGRIAPEEGSAQGQLGQAVGDALPDLVNADAPLVPGRVAEAETTGMKALELAGLLPVAGLIPDGVRMLRHYSPRFADDVPLSRLDPSYQGRGPAAGTERDRVAWLEREGIEPVRATHLYTEGARSVAPELRRHPYRDIPVQEADLLSDPAEIQRLARQAAEEVGVVGTTDPRAANRFEELIREAGYSGYERGNTVRWFEPLDVPEPVPERLARLMEEDKGFTLEPSGEAVNEGISVSMLPKDQEYAIPSTASPEEIAETVQRMYEDHPDLFEAGGKVGGWFDEDTNRYVFDVAEVFPSDAEGFAAANRAAAERGQDGIFDMTRAGLTNGDEGYYPTGADNPYLEGFGNETVDAARRGASDEEIAGAAWNDMPFSAEGARRNAPNGQSLIPPPDPRAPAPDELNYTGNDGRLERLRAAGFDTDTPLYHGTTQDYDFPRAKEGEFWATENPATAQGYAEDAAEGLRGIPQRLYTDEFGHQIPYGHQIRPMYGRGVQPTGPEGFSGPLPNEAAGGAWRDPRGVVMTTNPERHLTGMFDDIVPPPDLMAPPPPPRGGAGPFAPPSSPPPPDLTAPTMGAPYVRPTDMTTSDRTYGIFDPEAPRLEATESVDPLYGERAAPKAKTKPFFDALRRSTGLRNILDADVVRGLRQLDGRPWYELGGLRQFAGELGDGGFMEDLFRRWNIIGGAASAQNSVPNEMSLASIINWAERRGIMDYEEAGEAFRRITGTDNLPLISQGHFDSAQLGLNRGLLLPSEGDGIHYNAPYWKTPSYMQARQGASDALATLDTHERRRIWQYVLDNPNLRRLALNPETGFTASQIRKAEGTLPIRNLPDYQAVSEIYERGAQRFGLPSAAAYQAPRWTGGGVLTGLESNPTRTYQELLSDQVLHTARQRGMDTSPAGLRRLLAGVLRGDEFLLPGTLR